MAFLVSPGVEVKEIDLTNVVPAVSTSIGAVAGNFRWGPVEQVTTVGSEKELVSNFGKPNATNYMSFYNAATFLQYGNNLKVYRGVGTGAFNAVSGTDSGDAAILVKNADHYDTLTIANTGEFIAKYPGALGNSLKVVVITPASWGVDSDATSAVYQAQFDAAPSAGEMHILVLDEDGELSGVAGTVLEKFEYVSTTSTAKTADGASNYYANVVNRSSRWIWAGDAAPSLTSVVDLEYSLVGGVDVAPASVSALYSTAFGDSEIIDVQLLIGGAVSSSDANVIIAVADARKDCVAFVSPEIADTVGTTTPEADVLAWANAINSSSYGVLDSGAIYVYDKYIDAYHWVGAAGSVAGLCANTDDVADAWFSPAGFTRGVLRGVTKLAFNPTQANRDNLYKARVNPIASFPGQGVVLYGDKTAQTKPSAFDRINVRRLFITLEKAISTAAKFQLFEFNDEFTQAQFRNLVEPFLRDVQGRRGLTDFAVICDETNNTAAVVDTNRFVADIYIKPARSINFITLNFIATRSGVEFSEIVGQ